MGHGWIVSCLQDCEESIQLEPGFVKPRLRRAAALRALGRDWEAGEAFRRVLVIEPGCKEAVEGLEDCMAAGGVVIQMLICVAGGEVDEDEMLQQAIAMSLEKDKEDDNEEELLKRALAMSLEAEDSAEPLDQEIEGDADCGVLCTYSFFVVTNHDTGSMESHIETAQKTGVFSFTARQLTTFPEALSQVPSAPRDKRPRCRRA